MGHAQHRHRRHTDFDRAGSASGLLRRTQHYAECDDCPPDRSTHYRFDALDQLSELGLDVGHHRRAGRVAGIISIGVHSVGFCAKLLYEAIEEIDESQVEAVRATGASAAQTTLYGIVPQIMPAFAGISVFRWDINIRESTVLGLVGAGGIGLELNAAITQLYWTQVSLILLLIIGAVILGEWVSAKVRHAII